MNYALLFELHQYLDELEQEVSYFRLAQTFPLL